MKKYFEYPFNEEVKKKILEFYEDVNVDMHTSQVELKSSIKLKRILRQISFKKTDVVLDVGCSTGELFKYIHSEIAEGIGIDLSKNIINQNINKNKYSNIRYELFDGEHINISGRIDKMCLLDVLEHAFNPETLIKSIYDNLRGGASSYLRFQLQGGFLS